MPTENERKYVLRLDCEPVIRKVALGKQTIRQGYLIAARGTTVRVRSIDNGKTSYWHTLKCNNGRRVIEIENKLDKRDFEDLWELSMNRLEKTRYKMPDGWCIDFFLDHDDVVYFAMAECEMPEGQAEPKWIPDAIAKSLIFTVPAIDPRFSSKLVSDVRYAKNLFKECSS